MFNIIDELRDEAKEAEECKVDKTEALDIIATHIMLCAEELKKKQVIV